VVASNRFWIRRARPRREILRASQKNDLAMRFLRKSLLVLLALGPAVPAVSQTNQSLDPFDFTKSPTEWLTVVIDRPFTVRSVKGMIDFQNAPDKPLADVLLEIEGPGVVRKIRRATTRDDGRFRIKNVPQGTYRFQTTKSGLNSMIGTIVVSRKAPKTGEIEFANAVGN